MKMFYIICVLLLASITLNAQFNDFNAKAGLSKANEIAAAELDNAMLVGIGAVNFKKLLPDQQLDFSFNESTGKSKTWVYFYANSENEQDTTYIPIANTLLGYTDLRILAGDIPIDAIDFPFIKLNEAFIDSDAFISTLALSTDYMDMKSMYSDSEFEYVGISTNTNASLGDINTPYWNIVYSNPASEKTYLCYVNALNSETKCVESSPANVNYTINKELKVYPQPANDEIIVNVNNKYNSFKIVDIFGNEIRLNSQKLLNGDLLNLDISTLSEGVYFLILENQTNKDVVKFVKN